MRCWWKLFDGAFASDGASAVVVVHFNYVTSDNDDNSNDNS